MKVAVIQGSSRANGHTSLIVAKLGEYIDCDIVDLLDYDIQHYDYGHQQDDDFLPLMRRVVTYDTIIFATPVYWYAMSGMMKTFFDRITDCLKIEKDLGRQLRGKYMGAISCGSDDDEIEGFFVPFVSSAEYLGMEYAGHTHTWIGQCGSLVPIVDSRLQQFAQKLKNRGHSSVG